jgi:sulfide:quinone oxidoreductase
MPLELHRSRPPLRVLIAGGGVAGLEAALALRATSGNRVTVTMVSDSDHFHFRAVEVGEAFGLGRPHLYPIAPLAHDIDMRVVH